MCRILPLLLILVTTLSLAQRKNSAPGTQDLEEGFSARYLQSPKAYAVKAVDFNFKGMDFSPFPYKSGFVFVSSRTRKGARHEDENDFLSLFYVEESEEGTFLPPEPLEGESLSWYHEGPAVFFDSGKQKIFTRNPFVRKSKIKDGSVNPLELAHSAQLPSGKWTAPERLPLSTPEFSVGHPAISSDGTTLYFSSNMPGTIGESDLFVSYFQNGTWSSPRNLGGKINTSGQELFPFLFNDSILFFASNGRGGLGGLDLFYYNLDVPGASVVHIGEPLNSEGDDFGLYMEKGGSSGFFSSSRRGGVGADDIYYFEEIQPFVTIQLYDSLTGDVIGSADLTLRTGNKIIGKTRSDLTGAAEFRMSLLRDYQLDISAGAYKATEIELNPAYWPADQQAQIKAYLRPVRIHAMKSLSHAFTARARRNLTNVITFSSSPLDVDLTAELPATPPEDMPDEGLPDSASATFVKVIAVEIVNRIPAIIVVKNDTVYGFRMVSETTLVNDDVGIEIDIPRGAKRHDYEEIIRDQIVSRGYAISNFLLIRSFFFDSNKTWVRNDACAQLDKIIDVMHSHPDFELEMIFHSDSRGTEAFNLDLSKARADEVTAYLMKGGIRKERIHSSFVGEGQLLNDCGDLSDCDELLHQINRTTEFKFIID